MTLERTNAVLLNYEQWQICAPLAARAAVAARRHAKALPGDRRDAAAFEQLADQIERVARLLAEQGAAVSVPLVADRLARTTYSWVTAADDLAPELSEQGDVLAHLEAGGAVVEIRDPLHRGQTAPAATPASAPAPPAAAWRPPKSGSKRQPQAVLWESQLAAAAAGDNEPLVPSNISNRILTEGLRRYVEGDASVPARVVYQDGSEAAPFRLRCLRLAPEAPGDAAAVRLALISMRHNEMDDVVDGCLLRNRLVSRVRPAAETDQLAYTLARERLRALAGKGLAIEIYQTGFQPAVIGFYRALVDQLLEAPGSVAVVPHFHIHGSRFRPGQPWAVTA